MGGLGIAMHFSKDDMFIKQLIESPLLQETVPRVVSLGIFPLLSTGQLLWLG